MTQDAADAVDGRPASFEVHVMPRHHAVKPDKFTVFGRHLRSAPRHNFAH